MFTNCCRIATGFDPLRSASLFRSCPFYLYPIYPGVVSLSPKMGSKVKITEIPGASPQKMGSSAGFFLGGIKTWEILLEMRKIADTEFQWQVKGCYIFLEDSLQPTVFGAYPP